MEPTTQKSTVDEIRRRFDADVERFANLQTGQSATVDAPLALDLVACAAAATTPRASHVLDIGCGAGNFTLKLLERAPNLDVTLVDLSRPMLDRAHERISPKTTGSVKAVQSDVRDFEFVAEQFDVILAAAVLHHLRSDDQWRRIFEQAHLALRPGGSLWVFDLVEATIPAVQDMMWERYGAYLCGLKDANYRDEVFRYIAMEDSPRPLMFQLDLMRRAGFSNVDVLHKHLCFAAFGGVKTDTVQAPARGQ